MRLMKIKKITAILLAAGIFTNLAGCASGTDTKDTGSSTSTGSEASSQETENTDNSDSKTGSKGKLSVMIWDPVQEPGLTTMLGEFEEKTGIQAEIQLVKWGEYWTLLEAGAEGGSLPDVFWMNSNESQRYMSNDMLLDLTDRISESTLIEPSNYPDDIMGLYTYEDGYYAVPKDIDTVALWYNKEIFDEAGVAYPSSDWTWDEMYEIAKKLTKEDGSVYGIGMPCGNQQTGYFNLIYDKGGYVISDDKKKSGFDDPKTIESMDFIAKFIDEDLMPSQEVMAESSETTLFASGKIAMVIAGSWMLAEFANNEYTSANADVVELPKDAETNRRVSIYNGLGWSAAANTEMPDEAWQLIEYFGSLEGQTRQAELGVTMSAYIGTSETWIQSAPQFNLQAYLNMQEDMVIRPHSRNTVVWENASIDWFKRAWMKEITMEEACLGAAKEMNEILAEE